MSTPHPAEPPEGETLSVIAFRRQAPAAAAEPPGSLTPLIGRRREIEALRQVIRGGGVRLLTLTGPGGIGKTRLALAIAAALRDEFADGVSFVALGTIADAEQVLPAIAQAHGLRETAGASPAGLLARELADQHRLLVLDNLEQVVAATPQLAALLAACPALTILATSRVVLRVSGEQTFPVPPLALPAADSARSLSVSDLAATEAIAFFVERARAADAGFTLTEANAPIIAAICARLDGLPLALELAAARSRLLSPDALLARLSDRLRLLTAGARDLPERLRTMRDAIAWSHDLLDPAEQVLFRRLAVFAGGFTLDAAEAVMGAVEDHLTPRSGEADGDRDGDSARTDMPLDVLDGIGSLIDQSLVRRLDAETGEVGPRYAMLETIRDYGLERLAASGEAAATRDAHAAYWLALTQPPDAGHSAGAPDERWQRRLDAEHDNLRAALAWLAAGDDADASMRLASALEWFWHRSGSVREGVEWLARALARGGSDAVRVQALRLAGELAWDQGDYRRAVDWLEAALALARGLGDRVAISQVMLVLGLVAEKQDDDDRAVACYEEALTLSREAGYRPGAANALVNLGDAAYRRGDYAHSAALSEEGLAVSREVGDWFYAALALGNFGQLAIERGEPEEARARYREALELSRRAGHGWMIADSLAGLAAAATLIGRPAWAARWLGAANAYCAAIGAAGAAHFAQFARAQAAAQTGLSVPAFAAAWAAGHALSLEQAIAEATDPAAWPAPAAETAAPPEPAHDTRFPSADHGLTERELEVLRLLVAGHTDREIAEALFMGRRTAQGHVANICAKLGVRTRTAAATTALAGGLVPAIGPRA